MNWTVAFLAFVVIVLAFAYRRACVEIVQLREARARDLRAGSPISLSTRPRPQRVRESRIRTESVRSLVLVLVLVLASSGCAGWLGNVAACAPGSVAAVIDAVASRGAVNPNRVLDAGSCWLERLEKTPGVSPPEAVPELRAAIESENPTAAADALVQCDRSAPEVVRDREDPTR